MKSVFIRAAILSGLMFFAAKSYGQDWYDLTKGENVNYYKVDKAGQEYFNQRGKGKGSGYKLFVRWKYFARRIMDENGNVPSKSQIINRKRKFDQQYFQKRAKSDFAGDWKELGPFSWRATSSWNPGLGRITAIAIEEQNQ